MSTYKFVAEKRYGKYYGAIAKAGTGPVDTNSSQPIETVDDMIDFMHDQMEGLHIQEGQDSVIFRNVSYDDFGDLEWAVRRATY